MSSLTITLPPKQSQKAKEQAKKEGFKNPALWLQFLVEKQTGFEESPKVNPARIISGMKKTGLYKDSFLSELKKSLAYANKASK